MNKLRIALLGCGRIGGRHAGHIHTYGTLAAVCDTVPQKADELAALYGAPAYYNPADLLASENGIDVVAICTPNGLHAQHAIQALRAGCHVLVEKPMAIRSYDCGEMIKTAEQMNRRLFVIKQNRFNPPVAALKKALDDGWLGKIFSIQLTCFWNRDTDYYTGSDWKGTKDMDGGTLYTQFSHFIDLLYWCFGDVKNVVSSLKNFAHEGIIEFEDSGVAILEFQSGAIGTLNYSVNSTGQNMEGSLTVIGERGTVKIGGQYLNTLEYQQINGHVLETGPDAGNPPNQYGTYTGSMSNHGQVYRNLVETLQSGSGISTNFFEGLKTVEIIEKIYAGGSLIR